MSISSRASSSDLRHPSSRREVGTNIRRAHSLNGRVTGSTGKLLMRGHGTPEEDDALLNAIKQIEEKQKKYEEKQKKLEDKKWRTIGEILTNRKCIQCINKCQKFLNISNSRGQWSKEEDAMLVQLVNEHGPKNWSEIAHLIPGRNGNQCRDRWRKHLDPQNHKEAWTQEEDLVLIHYHEIHGNKWAHLTSYLPGRSNDAINRHWQTLQKSNKVVDSYINSGLLAQFRSLPPLVNNSDQPILPSSIRIEQLGGGRTICRYLQQQQLENSRVSHNPCSDSHAPPNNQQQQLPDYQSSLYNDINRCVPQAGDGGYSSFPLGFDYHFLGDQLEYYCQQAAMASSQEIQLFGRSYSTSALNPFDSQPRRHQDLTCSSFAVAGPSNLPDPAPNPPTSKN